MQQTIESFVLNFMRFFDETAMPFVLDHALPFFLFYGLPGLLITAIACYLLGLARIFKGSVTLELTEQTYELGNAMNGQALVTAKKMCI